VAANTNASGGANVRRFYKSKAVLWLLFLIGVSVAVFTYRFWSKAIPNLDFNFTSSATAGEKPPEPKLVTKTIKVKVRPDRWSEWVKLPPNMNFRISDQREGAWLVIKFWDGRCWDSRKHSQGVGWLGEIPNSKFKLRGNSGEVEIIFEPIRQ
jgi:hypothetical protein